MPSFVPPCKESNRSHGDATPRPNGAATAGNYFGAREPKILSTRRSPSFNWP